MNLMTACLISKVPLGNVRHLKQGGHEVVRPGLQGQRASWVNTGTHWGRGETQVLGMEEFLGGLMGGKD